MTTDDDLINEALLACLGGDPEDPAPAASLRRMSVEQWREFADLCKAQRVAAIVYARLKSAGLRGDAPPEALRALRRGYINSAHRNLWLQEALHVAVTACDEAGVQAILLKGAYLATHVYANPALREMGDVDLLVRKSQLGEALRVLQEAGFRSASPLPDDIAGRVTTSKHAPRLERGKAAIELHWTIFPPHRGETNEGEELWARAIPVSVARTEVLVLALEDLVLYLCAHAAYDHRFEFGLRPLCDLDRLVRRSGNDIHWPTVVERARAWEWRRGVYLALHLTRELIGTALPDDVLKALAPPSATPAIIATARRMVFTDPADAYELHFNLVRWHRQTLRERLRLLYERMIWCPEQKEPTLGYYARHMPSLALRHLPHLVRLSAGDRATRQLAQGKYALATWLKGESSPEKQGR